MVPESGRSRFRVDRLTQQLLGLRKLILLSQQYRQQAKSRRETLELVRAYYRITDPSIRKRVFDLIKSMGPSEG